MIITTLPSSQDKIIKPIFRNIRKTQRPGAISHFHVAGKTHNEVDHVGEVTCLLWRFALKKI